MKLMPVRTAQWLSITVLTAAVAYGAAQQPPQLPDGEGKNLYNSLCSSCHGAEVIMSKSGKDDWKNTIARMVSYGASIDPKQTEILADYLTMHFGPKDAAKEGAKEDPAKKILDTACGGCHGLDLVTGRTGTKAEWQEVVDRMIGRGASVGEKDIAPLVEYLTKTYPPK
jgi:cytochrome c5